MQTFPFNYRVLIPNLKGVVRSLRHAVTEGYLTEIGELIHADPCADFLQMAEHLLTEGYKDPVARAGGSGAGVRGA